MTLSDALTACGQPDHWHPQTVQAFCAWLSGSLSDYGFVYRAGMVWSANTKWAECLVEMMT